MVSFKWSKYIVDNSTSLTNSIPTADMTPYSMIIEFTPLY